jgi:U3 small nucleolar RNA-associated protein 21
VSVTCLANSPALDIVAIGLSDGRIILHNLKYDKTLFTFTHSPGPVTALSFRTGEKVKNYTS